MPHDPAPRDRDLLGEPELRGLLLEFVRRRVPAADVEDVVQTVLCEALAAPSRPAERSELHRWVLGIARHKVADTHRRASREAPAELPEIPAGPPPLEARQMVDWAEKQAASVHGSSETLRWMAREGEGDKLETIAADENVPAARVRQRVSRMRRWMRERWAAELALVAVLALAALVLFRVLRDRREVPEAVRPDQPNAVPRVGPEPSPLERAAALRAEAFERCRTGAWQPCLDGLDEARALDPAGDADPRVVEAREQARRALEGPPPETAPSPEPTEAPAPTAPAPGPTAAPTAAPTITPPFTKQKAAPTAKEPPKPAPKPPSKEPGPSKKGPAQKGNVDFFEGDEKKSHAK